MKKKKYTNGEKREIHLRYLYRNLKKSGKIALDMTFKQFRGVKVYELNTPSVQRGVPEGSKPEITIGDCYVWPTRKKKRKKSITTKKQRRKVRKTLRAKFRNLMNLAKKARRERRKAYEQKKYDRFEENQKKRLQVDEDGGQVPDVRSELQSSKE